MVKTLRQQMLIKAKKQGICTQCLKHPAQTGCRQCERCINTNRRKRDMSAEKYKEYTASAYDYRKFIVQHNPLRMKVHAFAKRNGICTKCFGRPADKPKVQCELCLERRRCWKFREHSKIGRPIMKRAKKTKQDTQKYNKLYKKKRFYKKMSKIKLLTRAIETGATL